MAYEKVTLTRKKNTIKIPAKLYESATSHSIHCEKSEYLPVTYRNFPKKKDDSTWFPDCQILQFLMAAKYQSWREKMLREPSLDITWSKK